MSLVLGLLAAGANVAGGLPILGSLAFGASWAGVGLVATGLTAVACQLSPSARTCAAHRLDGDRRAVRAPRGRGHHRRVLVELALAVRLEHPVARAYGDTRWWVLLLYVALASVLVLARRCAARRRDLGAGIVAPRPGPATGSPRLADALALSLRVHTPMLVGWTAAIAVLGLVFGAISPSFDAFDSAGVRDMLERIGGEGALPRHAPRRGDLGDRTGGHLLRRSPS